MVTHNKIGILAIVSAVALAVSVTPVGFVRADELPPTPTPSAVPTPTPTNTPAPTPSPTPELCLVHGYINDPNNNNVGVDGVTIYLQEENNQGGVESWPVATSEEGGYYSFYVRCDWPLPITIYFIDSNGHQVHSGYIETTSGEEEQIDLSWR